jgi:hypothetical protein
MGAWWWSRQRTNSSRRAMPDRGTVIFDNTPAATDADVL